MIMRTLLTVRVGLEKNRFIVTVFKDPLKALSKFTAGLYDLVLIEKLKTEDVFCDSICSIVERNLPNGKGFLFYKETN